MPATTQLPDGSMINQIGTTLGKWADGFNNTGDPTPNPDKWTIVRQNGITTNINNGQISFSVPTTSGAEYLMVGKALITIPANLTASLSATVRNSTTVVRIGYVACDQSTGLPIAHDTISGDFAHRANVLYTGTTATSLTIESVASSNTVKTVGISNQVSTSANHEVSMELRPEDFIVATATADSSSARVTGGRISSQVPTFDLVYRPFVWILNNATSVAATWNLARILSMDIQELQVEVGGGRGNTNSAQSIPVLVTNGSTISNATLSSANNSATLHQLISAASVNSTLVKSTAGRISGGVVANTTATWRFLKFFNKATAPTVGTDTPVFTVALAPNTTIGLGSVFDQYGLYFGTGITYAITGAAATNDTTAIAAGDIVLSLLYA